MVGPTETVFNGSEQYYQLAKVEAVGDERAYLDIMALSDPGQMKRKATQIVGLDLDTWREEFDSTILTKGCLRKFKQCEDLADHLMYNTSEVIAEASPHDMYYLGLGGV